MNPYLIPGLSRKNLTPLAILDYVSIYYNIPVPYMLSSIRKGPYVKARRAAMWVMRNKLKMSFPKIAEVFRGHGRTGRDHTAVMSLLKGTDDLMSVYPEYQAEMDSIVKFIYGEKTIGRE